MNRDEIIEQTAQVVHVAIAHRWMTVYSALSEDRDYPELLRDIARALADAGLLAQPLPSREEIADVILAESLFGSRTPIAAADAVLALLKGQEV